METASIILIAVMVALCADNRELRKQVNQARQRISELEQEAEIRSQIAKRL